MSAIVNTRVSGKLQTNVFNVEDYGASPGASYATNKAALQAALNAANAAGGGTVSLTTPGTYLAEGTCVIYSNTELHLGAGVVWKQAPSATRGEAGRTLFVNNAYANNADKTITSITSSNRTCTVTATAHGLAVGDWFVVYGVATDGYGGVHQVVTSADADTITYLSHRPLAATPCVASAYTGFTTMKLRKCDVNIALTGQGTIDYDDTNTATGLSTLQTHAVIMAGIHDLTISNLKIFNSLKYCVFLSGVRKATILSTYTTGPSDGIHATGNCFDVDIISVGTAGGDNNVALGSIDYTGYNIFPGFMENISVRGVGQSKGLALRVFGSAEYFFRGIHFEDVRGGSNAVDVANIQLAVDASCVGGGVVNIKDITIVNSVGFTSASGSMPMVGVSGTIDKLLYKDSTVQFPSTAGRIIQVYNNAAISTLILQAVKMAAGHSVVNIDAGATCTDIILDSIVASCSYCINNAANTPINIFANNCKLTNSGGSFRETSSTGKMTLYVTNTTCSVWLQRSGTQTFVSKSPLVQVDIAAANPWLDVGAGNMAYNTNAAAGTLGQAGAVIYDTVRAKWILMADTTLTS